MKILYRWWFGAPCYRALKLHMLGFSGLHPVRGSFLGMVGRSESARARWLRRMAALGARAA